MSFVTRHIAPLFIAPALALVLGARAAPDERLAAAAAPGSATLTPSQFEQLKGRYRLQDGSLLVISGSARSPKAALDDFGPVPVRALSASTLISDDGRIVLRFSDLAEGDYASVRLSLPASDPLLAKAGH